jgi:peptide/nickel transport system substrate-binding protein
MAGNNNPFDSSSDAAHFGFRYMIWEPLAMQNLVKPTSAAKPWLATKWDWSSGYNSLTLTIRDGVKWSDGTPLTADDVANTFQIMKANAALNQYALPISDATASGNQVTVTFSASQFVNETKVLSTLIVQKKQVSTMSDPSKDLFKQPVGTGPYTVQSASSQTVTLAARDGYWQAAPAVKQIHYTTYTGNDTQLSAFTSGACEWSYEFLANAKTTFVAKDPAHFHLWFPAALSADGLWFNTTKAPYDNAALRKAIGMVINRADVFNQGEAGYFKPEIDNITGIPTPAGSSFIAPDYQGKSNQSDVATAKSTLTAAGFTYKGSTLTDPKGKPVTITLADPAGWDDYQTDLAIIKDNLSQLGIDATINKANTDQWFTDVANGNFDAVMHWTNGGATPYDMYENVMDGAALQPIGKASNQGNYGRFNSPDATAALNAFVNAADDASRTTAMNKIEQIFVDQAPMIPTSAGNLGAEYTTTHWTGWPDDSNPYAAAQPTLVDALDVVLHLKPAS